jgi:hypothetical protein
MSTSTVDADAPSLGDVLATMAPGPELAAMLAGIDPAVVDDDGDLLEIIAASDRLISSFNAQHHAAIAELARRPWLVGVSANEARARRGKPGQVEREFVVDEIAARLSLSPGAATFRVSLAANLAGTMTATAAALASGAIDIQKARAITDGCNFLDPATALEVEATVLPRAPQQTAAQVRKSVQKAAITADPIAAQQRHVARKDERGVWLVPQADGMADIHAVLTAADALAVHDALTAAAKAAKKAGEETRNMAQLRADFLVAPFRAAIETGELAGLVPAKLATHRGNRGEADLTVPASAIMGVSNAPGELAGYGAITAEVARIIARDRKWRRIVTNPVDGSFLAADADTYRPPAVLARHVELRDQTCVFLGCPRRAVQCHLDHSKRYPDGCTCDRNLGPLCEHHHIFKHALEDALGHLKQPEPGTFVWTMPTGHVYTRGQPAIAPPVAEESVAIGIASLDGDAAGEPGPLDEAPF